MILFCFFVCIFCGYTTAVREVGKVESVTYNVNTNGSVTLTCQTSFPVTNNKESKINRHSWKFGGQTLTKNTNILATNPSRYNVGYRNNSPKHVYILTIPNPVQTDEGKYQCQFDYTWYGSTHIASKDVDVTIDSYLPPLNYPLCSIRPNQTVSNGNVVEFKCIIGETTERITLKWTLQSHDGSITDQNYGTTTSILTAKTTVTLQYNNSMFICEMTSETFPTAYRNCSAGPLTIYEEEQYTTEMSTQSIKPMTMGSTTEGQRDDSTAESIPPNRNNSNRTARKVPVVSIVGCAIGALFLSFLIIIGVVCQTGKNTCRATLSLKRMRQINNSSDSVSFSSDQRSSNSLYEPSQNQPSAVGMQPSSSDIRSKSNSSRCNCSSNQF